METVTQMGAIVFPPVPAFYQRPASMEEMVDHTLARVLDLLKIEHALAPPWTGFQGFGQGTAGAAAAQVARSAGLPLTNG